MKRVLWSFAIAFVLVQLSVFLLPTAAHAIPAWGRKYNAPCAMCHYPAVPRLNTLGHQFRRAGYRMSDEFGKDQEISQVGNFLSGRVRPRVSFEDMSTGGTKTEVQLSDATLFYSGAFSRYFSAFTEVEVGGDGEVELVASVSGIYGSSDHFSTFRVGQMHLLSRVGFGGFDRPTGISSPSILSEQLTTAIPFVIGEDQKAFELTHVHGWTRLIAQVSNGLDDTGSGTASSGDSDKGKDVMLAFERIFDDIASGMTLYGYLGTWHDTPLNANEFNFLRYGITANKAFPAGFEILGGYMRSKDNVPASVGSDASGDAFFVELEQYLRSIEFALLGRYDYVDPDVSAARDHRQKVTLGGVKTVNDNVRLALEASRLRDHATPVTDYRVLAELMVNF